MKKILVIFVFMFALLLTACGLFSGSQPATGSSVLAVETFLADIAQNVAGERFVVETLMPYNMDPHTFSPTVADVNRIAGSGIIIVNGNALETWLSETMKNVSGTRLTIQASDGLKNRGTTESDPHFWLNPLFAIHYAEKIRDEFIAFDPAGEADFTRSTAIYIARLNQLDAWIEQEVAQIPPEQRLLVTDHDCLGYFADRYGFKIVGTVLPGLNNNGAPSEAEMAALIEQIKLSGAKAIFLEAGSNPQLAEQIAAEAGVKVVAGLYTHSLTPPGEPAPTYIEMMKANVRLIVSTLK